eukprot:m.256903 g.256903  ORF g.256903 m.256903 type:complete len:168 (-) comp34806_c0_seq1:298-801(-)
MASIVEFSVPDASGRMVSLGDLASNKVCLIVNVASKCGFTPQYEWLQGLYEKYQDQGFCVIGFPCNQFGSQEPDDAAKVVCTMKDRFKVSFPIMQKIDVNGKNTTELYAYLKKEKKGVLGTTSIKWNFTKFLCDKNGVPVKRFGPTTKENEIEKGIQKLLAAQEEPK